MVKKNLRWNALWVISLPAGGGEYSQINSLPVCVNPGSAFNSYWTMPFRKSCKITVENIDVAKMRIYYQIDYTLTDVPQDAAYFHAQFRRVNPLPYKEDYTILDNVKGQGPLCRYLSLLGCEQQWMVGAKAK